MKWRTGVNSSSNYSSHQISCHPSVVTSSYPSWAVYDMFGRVVVQFPCYCQNTSLLRSPAGSASVLVSLVIDFTIPTYSILLFNALPLTFAPRWISPNNKRLGIFCYPRQYPPQVPGTCKKWIFQISTFLLLTANICSFNYSSYSNKRIHDFLENDTIAYYIN